MKYNRTGKKLLIVGPKPPPVGGAPLTVQAILDELSNYSSIKVALVNTSPSTDVRKKMTGFKLEKLRRTTYIILKYVKEIKYSDAVLVFSNNLFILTLGFIFYLIARYFKKPFYIKPIGGDLDVYLGTLSRSFREYLLFVLRAADGVFVQTHLLKESLSKIGCNNTHYFPGCRSWSKITGIYKTKNSDLRLIFLSHISKEKGPLILLDALQLLADENTVKVTCDFYGPIHDEIQKEFLYKVAAAKNVRYVGIAETGTALCIIAAYDVLVLPTYFTCEGHPGVIIEAMHAGVPVISTQHRAIPELIKNGENGILVPLKDKLALAEAIKRISVDKKLRRKMGKQNYNRGKQFRTEKVIRHMLETIFPKCYNVSR